MQESCQPKDEVDFTGKIRETSAILNYFAAEVKKDLTKQKKYGIIGLYLNKYKLSI